LAGGGGGIGGIPEFVRHLVLLHVALQAESFVSQLGKNTLIKKEN
jgi:hypothetical protein